jgi:hypothetical protein
MPTNRKLVAGIIAGVAAIGDWRRRKSLSAIVTAHKSHRPSRFGGRWLTRLGAGASS